MYLPHRGSGDKAWVTPKKCVWKAPNFIDLWHPLAAMDHYDGNETLESLFCTILEVKDADWSHCISQLEEEKKRQGPHTLVSDIYDQLWEDSYDEVIWESIM